MPEICRETMKVCRPGVIQLRKTYSSDMLALTVDGISVGGKETPQKPAKG